MTDPADRSLEERLHALAHGVHVPVVPPEHDVRRGRRRLLRMRVAMAGATTGTLAVVLGVTGLTAGDPKASEVPPATNGPTVLPTKPTSSPSANGRDGGSAPGSHGSTGSSAALGSGPGAGSKGSDSAVPPDRNQVKNAPTAAATTGAGQQPGGAPWGDPSTTPTSTPDPTGDPTATPSGDPTPTPTDPVTPTPTDPTTSPPPTLPPPAGGGKVRVDPWLAYYNDVLAEDLDPDRGHLQPYDRTVDPQVTRKADGLLFALGSTYRWHGGSSLSGLEITVATGWDQVDWDCGATGSDWVCHPVDSGAVRTEVATHDGVRQVAVEHEDGRVVVLTADPTYAPRSRTAALNSVGGSEAALVAAASDARLVLPGDAPQAPPTIDSATFSTAGQAALLGDGRTFEPTSLDRSPSVRGTWSGPGPDGGTTGGTLAWSARPIYSGGAFTCLTTYLRCSTVAVGDDGTTVQLALVKTKAGGGWLVQYDGPAYAVRVYSSNRLLPKKLAYAFVTQADWQPSRDDVP
jgi:hypothetical protein